MAPTKRAKPAAEKPQEGQVAKPKRKTTYTGGQQERFKLKHMEEALRRGAGITSAAALILQKAYGHCTSQTVRNYMARHPQLRQAVEEAIEDNIDKAEARLLTAIGEGTDWAVKFYLETKGKNRGYTRRQEIAGVPAQPLVVTDARSWLVEQLDEMESRIRPQSGGADSPLIEAGPPEAPPETFH
jgi:hypothetical protein